MLNLLSRSCILIVLVLYNCVSFGQESPSGYIINLDGDTTWGKVSYRMKVRTPRDLTFTETGANTEVKYSAADIRGFGNAGVNFLSAIVSVDKNSVGNNITSSPKFDLYTDTVFLQTLNAGSKTLHVYRDGLNVDHFYVFNNDKFELLLFKNYMSTDKDGKTNLVTLSGYKDQLKRYLSECSQIDKKLERSTYQEHSLISIFNTYYQCIGSKRLQEVKKDRKGIRFGAIAGFTNTGIRFTRNDKFLITRGNTTKSTDFTGGLFLEVDLPKSLNRVSFNAEVTYSSFQVEGNYRLNHFTYYEETRSTVGATYMKLNTLVRYRFPFRKSNAFLNAGLSNGLASGIDNFSREELVLNGVVERSREGTAVGDYRKYEQGYIVGAGVKHKRYSLEGRMEKSNGMSSYNSFGTYNTRFSILLGVALF